MADVEQAIYSILSNDAGVSAIVSTRIYPVVIPQDVTLPATAYQRISTRRHEVHGAASELARARFQITSVAVDYDTMRSLANAIRGALDAYDATVASVDVQGALIENEIDEYGLVNDLFTVRQDVIIWHAES